MYVKRLRNSDRPLKKAIYLNVLESAATAFRSPSDSDDHTVLEYLSKLKDEPPYPLFLELIDQYYTDIDTLVFRAILKSP